MKERKKKKIFSKNQLLVLLILCIVLFVSTWLISALSLIISCHLLLLGEFASFCSRAFRCAVKLLVLALSSFFSFLFFSFLFFSFLFFSFFFFSEALTTMSFPLTTAFLSFGMMCLYFQ